MAEQKVLLGHLKRLDEKLNESLWGGSELLSSLIDFAMTLGTIFALILVAKICYEGIKGEGFDFKKLGKPFFISCILANWLAFSQIIFSIAKPLEMAAQRQYELEAFKIDSLKEERLRAAKNLSDLLKEKKTQADLSREINKREGDGAIDGTLDYAKEQGIDAVTDNITNSNNLFEEAIALTVVKETLNMNWLESFVVWIGELLWDMSIYFVFLLKYICTIILVFFGPIFISVSLIPKWSSGWKEWIERAVHTSCYGVVAYITMVVAMQIIKYAIQADIDLLNNTLQDDKSFFAYIEYSSKGNFGTLALYVLSLFAGTKLVLMVPEFAIWIWPGNSLYSASSFIQGMQNATEETARFAGDIAMAALTGGVAGVTKVAAETAGSALASCGSSSSEGRGKYFELSSESKCLTLPSYSHSSIPVSNSPFLLPPLSKQGDMNDPWKWKITDIDKAEQFDLLINEMNKIKSKACKKIENLSDSNNEKVDEALTDKDIKLIKDFEKDGLINASANHSILENLHYLYISSEDDIEMLEDLINGIEKQVAKYKDIQNTMYLSNE